MNDGKIRISAELDTKTFDAQIAKLERELEIMTKALETDSQVDVKVRMNKDERLKLEKDIESVKNKIISLKQQKEKLEKDKPTFDGLKNGFESLTKSAKKMILGIVGIRTAFSLMRKATSAYMATDDNLTSTMESNWIGLGAILSPIIEMIVKGIKKIVTGVLYFAQLLTGVNFIAKANEAILRKQTKSTKELTKANDKLNASFDEMEVLQDNSDKGSNADNASTAPSLFNANDLSEGTRKKIEQLAKALEPIYKIIKSIINLAIQNPEVIMAILGGLGLLSFLKKVLGVGGKNGSGLFGIQSVLNSLATMGVISIVINVSKIVKTLNETREATDAVDDYIDARREQAKVDADTSKKLIQSGKMTDVQTKKMINTNKEAIETMEDNNEVVLDTLNGYSKLQLTTKNMTGELQNNINTLQSNLYAQYQELQVLEELYRAGKLNKEETEDYKNKLAAFNEILNGTSEQAKDTRKWFNYFGDSTEKLAELQAYASNTAREFDASLKGVVDSAGVAETGIKDLNKMLGVLPKNNVIKVKTDGVNEAKKGINGILDNLINLTKKTFKVKTEVQITSVVTSQVLSMADLGANVIKKIYGLASGGIVNNPGRGVPISSNVIAGEAGPEVVLPLNETTMTWLARLIADNMSVNLTNINQMNGRQISKEIKRISANENYAFNM